MPTITATIGWPTDPHSHTAVFPIEDTCDLICDVNVTEITDNQTGEVYKHYTRIAGEMVCRISPAVFRLYKELGF